MVTSEKTLRVSADPKGLDIASSRSRISPAALFVKVMARMLSGATPFSRIKYAIRTVSVRVLPVPGPATITSGASMHSTAARCSGLRPARRSAAWCVVRAICGLFAYCVVRITYCVLRTV